ncbi:unnamed protein product [Moneuplotes crassus]|uniref:Uncharacterized protein n=1 Tax=Euplotes crassus TaxID=5936 RepID=A0AAD1XCI9_EUPCR|nr:unnamed protein product [Moneuplotes crassus]
MKGFGVLVERLAKVDNNNAPKQTNDNQCFMEILIYKINSFMKRGSSPTQNEEILKSFLIISSDYFDCTSSYRLFIRAHQCIF